MNESAQKKLDDILEKENDLNSITENEKIFLRARRDHLTGAQREAFKSVIDVSKKEVKENREQEKAEAKEQKKADKELYKDLQTRANKMGMEKVVGKSREELEAFVRTKEGPDYDYSASQ